jgi:hypothetical protein
MNSILYDMALANAKLQDRTFQNRIAEAQDEKALERALIKKDKEDAITQRLFEEGRIQPLTERLPVASIRRYVKEAGDKMLQHFIDGDITPGLEALGDVAQILMASRSNSRKLREQMATFSRETDKFVQGSNISDVMTVPQEREYQKWMDLITAQVGITNDGVVQPLPMMLPAGLPNLPSGSTSSSSSGRRSRSRRTANSTSTASSSSRGRSATPRSRSRSVAQRSSSPLTAMMASTPEVAQPVYSPRRRRQTTTASSMASQAMANAQARASNFKRKATGQTLTPGTRKQASNVGRKLRMASVRATKGLSREQKMIMLGSLRGRK